MMLMKEKRWICKPYTDWVKKQFCCASMAPADDPHHIHGKGMKIESKPHDWMTFPLTRFEHTDLHHDHVKWEAKNGNQAEMVLKTLREAVKQGIIEINYIG